MVDCGAGYEFPGVMSAAQVARAVGVTRQNLTGKWVPAGCPRNADGTFDLVAVVQWKTGREREAGYQEGLRDGNGEGAGAGSSPALELKRGAEAELKLLELATALEEVVPRVEVDAALGQAVATFAARLAGLPAQVAPRLAGLEAHAIAAVLEAEVRRAVDGVSEDFLRVMGGGEEAEE